MISGRIFSLPSRSRLPKGQLTRKLSSVVATKLQDAPEPTGKINIRSWVESEVADFPEGLEPPTSTRNRRKATVKIRNNALSTHNPKV